MYTINDNHMMYGSWDMERDGQTFLPFWAIFALLPLQRPGNQNFEKMKKMPGDIIILHKCTKNYDQIIYGSWDMVRDGLTDGWKKSHIEVRAPYLIIDLVGCLLFKLSCTLLVLPQLTFTCSKLTINTPERCLLRNKTKPPITT